MLALFILQLFTILSCISAGFLLYRLFPANGKRSLVMYFISGLVALTLIAQVLILFFPLNVLAQVILAVLLVMMLLFNRSSFILFVRDRWQHLAKIPTMAWACMACLWFVILLINAGVTMSDDTESYHIQMVKWIREYGSVPGLVHLHSRYGFNSSWFTTTGLFSIQAGNLNFYTSLNATLAFVCASYLVASIARASNPFPQLAVLLVSIVAWPLLRGSAANSGYDFVTAMLILVLFLETARSYQDNEKGAGHAMNNLHVEYIIWPAFLFSVRITNFPLIIVLISGLVMLWRLKPAQAIGAAGVAVLLVLPFLTRNVILSGYAFYPSMSVDPFNVDWKADPVRTRELLDFIRFFNRVSDQHQEISVTAKQGLAEWLPLWAKHMFMYDRIIVGPGLAGFLLVPFFLKKNILLQGRMIRLLLIAFLVQTVVWFIVAPDPRFLYGPLLCGSVILVSIIPVAGRFKMAALSLALITCVCLSAYTVYSRHTVIGGHLILPYQFPQPAVKTISVDGIQLYIPGKLADRWNPRCLDTPLPCVYEVVPGLRARGAGIGDGFKLTGKDYMK